MMRETDRRRLFYLFYFLYRFPLQFTQSVWRSRLLFLYLYRSPHISSDVMFFSAVFGSVLQQSPIQYAMVTHITAGTCMYYVLVCALALHVAAYVFSVAAFSACLRVMSRVTGLHDSLFSSVILAA